MTAFQASNALVLRSILPNIKWNSWLSWMQFSKASQQTKELQNTLQN